jgi:hypothetical protein
MGYKRVPEENHYTAEKQTSRQIICEVTKYNINRITTTTTENRSIITVLIVIIIILSIIYYLCAEPTATRPITNTAQCRCT